VRLKDNESASFGAEALPGGLREINAARGDRPQAAGDAGPAQAHAPLVGLIALVTHWLGRGRKRR
jgi:hypothetical protein